MADEERSEPRISINKLGEYLTARAGRRRRILEDAKRPRDFIAPRFRDFYEVAPRYLSSSPIDDEIVHAAIDAIQGRVARTEWEEQNKNLNTDLLTNLLDVPDIIDMEQYATTVLDETGASTMIEGVEVSVRPEIGLETTVRGRDLSGVLKLYTPKTHPLNQDTADYIATVIHRYALENDLGNGDVDHRHCFVVDVPAKTVFAAPRSYTRRMNDVMAACEEIASRWQSI